MDRQAQRTPQLDRLAELIGEARIAMLTTAEPDGALRSRPLVTLQMDAQGCLWFFTRITSPKALEIASHREVNLSYSDPDRQDYVSVSGLAEFVRDRAQMRALWSASLEPWFPAGLDDPELVLLRVQVRQAEYWDAPQSKVQRLYGLAKAVATRDATALGEHEKLTGPTP
jgi:general stress protein 26